jgi:hypothetical protein
MRDEQTEDGRWEDPLAADGPARAPGEGLVGRRGVREIGLHELDALALEG